jgi:iron complex outermembrane receptor protein
MVVTGEIATLTIDAYVINIDDRTNAVSTQDVSTDETSGAAYANYLALAAAGVDGANSIGGVNWFTNAFDTSTSGVDIVATMPFDFENSNGKLTASLNYNDVSFESDVETLGVYFNAESRYDFTNFTPNTRWILTYNHYMGDWSAMGRASYYGEWDNCGGGSCAAGDVQTYDAVVYLDLEVSYSVTDELKVSLGGRNLTDEYPAKDELFDACCGQKYLGNSLLDWQGSYYYGRLSYNF